MGQVIPEEPEEAEFREPEPHSSGKWADAEESVAMHPQETLTQSVEPQASKWAEEGSDVGQDNPIAAVEAARKVDHSEPKHILRTTPDSSEFDDLSFALEQDGYAGQESRTGVQLLQGQHGPQDSASDFVDVGHAHEETATDTAVDNELEALSEDAARLLAQLAL
jgi:hypothetical protein